MTCYRYLATFLLLVTRDVLLKEVDDLRTEQRYMEKDLQSVKTRWHDIREKKVEVANTLRDFKKAEEELEHLSEEERQLDLEEKVDNLTRYLSDV